MSRRYPQIGNSGKVPKEGSHSGRLGLIGHKCYFCSEDAVSYIDIEVSYMRGDDDVVCLCEKHKYLTGYKQQDRLLKMWKGNNKS